jgi:hypothetical protein
MDRRPVTGHSDAMTDRPFRAVDELIRRVQRVAANRPDPLHILAQTIGIIGESDVDCECRPNNPHLCRLKIPQVR